jgi:hypothetical protein
MTAEREKEIRSILKSVDEGDVADDLIFVIASLARCVSDLLTALDEDRRKQEGLIDAITR